MSKNTVILILGIAMGISIGVIGSNIIGKRQDSPYVKETYRLADVVAAIQILGGNKFDSGFASYWQDTIGSIPKSANGWSVVFEEHPEFFRTNDKEKKVSLVLRRGCVILPNQTSVPA